MIGICPGDDKRIKASGPYSFHAPFVSADGTGFYTRDESGLYPAHTWRIWKLGQETTADERGVAEVSA